MKEMTPKRQMQYTNCNTAAVGPAKGQDGGSEPTPSVKSTAKISPMKMKVRIKLVTGLMTIASCFTVLRLVAMLRKRVRRKPCQRVVSAKPGRNTLSGAAVTMRKIN